jgi:hypothetical protein
MCSCKVQQGAQDASLRYALLVLLAARQVPFSFALPPFERRLQPQHVPVNDAPSP